MKTVSTKINSKLYEDLVNTCNNSGCSVSEKLRELIQSHSECGSSGDMKQDLDSNIEPLVIPTVRNVRIYQNGRWHETNL